MYGYAPDWQLARPFTSHVVPDEVMLESAAMPKLRSDSLSMLQKPKLLHTNSMKNVRHCRGVSPE